jgi:hypothetical protein
MDNSYIFEASDDDNGVTWEEEAALGRFSLLITRNREDDGDLG